MIFITFQRSFKGLFEVVPVGELCSSMLPWHVKRPANNILSPFKSLLKAFKGPLTSL
jgi:hypothetical protein